MADPTPATSVRRLDIEGLRGLAVLLVVCFHAGLSAFSGAFVAVDVFFVLSGFFLTSTLLRLLATGEDIALGDVYARRLWRLMPAMVVVVLATLAMSMFFYAPIDRAAVADHARPVALFGGNLAFAAQGVNYFSALENPLLHTWTLGVELQLMLLFPALVLLLASIGKKRAAGIEPSEERRVSMMKTILTGILIVGAISFAIAVWINDSAPMWAYFGPHARLWSLCAGAAMAFVAGGGQSVFGANSRAIGLAQLVGLAALFIPAFIYNRNMAYPGMIALVPVGGTMLLLSGGALATETPIGRLLASRPLAWLGRVSYPWYLWHWPVMVLGAVLIPEISPLGRFAFGLGSLGLAVLTQNYVERTVHTNVWPKLGRPIVAAVGVSLVLVLIAQWSSVRSRSFVQQSVHRTFAAARDSRMNHSCWAGPAHNFKPEGCAFGDAQSSTTFGLVGDSHAEHWLGGLEGAGKALGFRVEAHVMGACPVSDFRVNLGGYLARQYAGCASYREATLKHLVKQKPFGVILSNSDYYIARAQDGGVPLSDAEWTAGLRRTYSRLSGAGINVIVIRGTPWVPFDVPACHSRRAAGLFMATDCTYTPDRAFIARAQRMQNAAARGLNVRFVDMNDQVCGGGARCNTLRGPIVTHTDDNHITANFSRSLAPVLGQRIAEAIGR